MASRSGDRGGLAGPFAPSGGTGGKPVDRRSATRKSREAKAARAAARAEGAEHLDVPDSPTELLPGMLPVYMPLVHRPRPAADGARPVGPGWSGSERGRAGRSPEAAERAGDAVPYRSRHAADAGRSGREDRAGNAGVRSGEVELGAAAPAGNVPGGAAPGGLGSHGAEEPVFPTRRALARAGRGTAAWIEGLPRGRAEAVGSRGVRRRTGAADRRGWRRLAGWPAAVAVFAVATLVLAFGAPGLGGPLDAVTKPRAEAACQARGGSLHWRVLPYPLWQCDTKAGPVYLHRVP